MSPAPTLNAVDVSERLTALETSFGSLRNDLHRIESGIDKVIQTIEKREVVILKEVDELEQRLVGLERQVNQMEQKISFYQGAIAIIAFLWPAILKFFL